MSVQTMLVGGKGRLQMQEDNRIATHEQERMYITATQNLPRQGLHRLAVLLEAKDYTDDMFLIPFFSESEWELSCPIPSGKRFVAVIPGDSEGDGMTYRDSAFPAERLRQFLERHGIQ